MKYNLEPLYALCESSLGSRPLEASALPAAGGDRQYYRLRLGDGRSVIGVRADSAADARAFVSLSEAFAAAGVRVPAIFGATPDFIWYLEEDLGDTSLFSRLTSVEAPELVARTVRELALLNTVPAEAWRDLTAYSPFSRRLVMWDLNYFKYEFLKPAGVAFDEDRLEDDFENFAEKLTDTDPRLWGFMMRDCQSRNVMLTPEPCFIDYQGGRFGPCVYDAVSLMWQAKAGFSDDFRREMLALYAGEFGRTRGVDPAEVTAAAGPFALFRTLQVLGAYGFRGLVQKRAHFIESIPGALLNLRQLVEDGETDLYPELKKVCVALTGMADRFSHRSDGRLHVKVFSFSYKKGYPEDLSGNGGGFMFDCRGLHNPGRYDEYKRLTGRDLPVIEFLRTHSDADGFARKACDLVAPSVETYLRRGFDSLQVGFGCTGGRHRSVYCAEAVARALAEAYPDAVVELIHREQGITEIFNQNQR